MKPVIPTITIQHLHAGTVHIEVSNLTSDDVPVLMDLITAHDQAMARLQDSFQRRAMRFQRWLEENPGEQKK